MTDTEYVPIPADLAGGFTGCEKSEIREAYMYGATEHGVPAIRVESMQLAYDTADGRIPAHHHAIRLMWPRYPDAPGRGFDQLMLPTDDVLRCLRELGVIEGGAS